MFAHNNRGIIIVLCDRFCRHRRICREGGDPV